MQPILRPLFVLHPDAWLKQHLAQAPMERAEMREVPDWAALHRALERAPLTAIAVVDPRGADGEPAPELRELLRAFPLATVVAALHLAPRDVELLKTLVEWGTADFIVMDREVTLLSLAHRLERVRSRSVELLLRRALPRGIPIRANTILTRAAEVVSTGGGPAEMAASFHMSRRTLPRWFARAELPPPKRLFAWLRLLLVAEMLDDPRKTMASAARACGYAGEPSLKNTVREFMECSPGQLRERGAFRTVAKAFSDELIRLRDRAHALGKSDSVWLSR